MGVGGTGKLRVNTPARIAQDDTRLWGSNSMIQRKRLVDFEEGGPVAAWHPPEEVVKSHETVAMCQLLILNVNNENYLFHQ